MPKSLKKKSKLFIKEILILLAFCFVLLISIRIFLVEQYKVTGKSMEPTFKDGDRLIAEKISTTKENFEKGDILIFTVPSGDNKIYVKRIVGLPGDTLLFNEGSIFVQEPNTKSFIEIAEAYVKANSKTTIGKFIQRNPTVTLGPNEYFMLGDNREQSTDSRDFGPITKEEIVGKVLLKYWPNRKIY